MRGAMVILVAMVVIGVILYLTDLLYYRKKEQRGADSGGMSDGQDVEKSEEESAGDDSECCGMHIVCEKTSLSPVSDEIIYYDDDELDRFKGRNQDDYDQEEIDEFQDVLLTLLPDDIPGWARSLQLRQIEPPREIREELLMMVREMRDKENNG